MDITIIKNEIEILENEIVTNTVIINDLVKKIIFNCQHIFKKAINSEVEYCVYNMAEHTIEIGIDNLKKLKYDMIELINKSDIIINEIFNNDEIFIGNEYTLKMEIRAVLRKASQNIGDIILKFNYFNILEKPNKWVLYNNKKERILKINIDLDEEITQNISSYINLISEHKLALHKIIVLNERLQILDEKEKILEAKEKTMKAKAEAKSLWIQA